MPPNLSSAPSSSGKSSRKTCFVSKHRPEQEEPAVACTAERWRRRRHDLQLSSIMLPATPQLLLSYCHPLSIPAVPKPFYLQMRSTICSPTSSLGGAARLWDKLGERAWSTEGPSFPISSASHGERCCLSSLLLKAISGWKITTVKVNPDKTEQSLLGGGKHG